MNFALFHSPVVGPSTWRWVGASLDRAGHEVVIPDLRSVAREGEPRALAVEAASAVPDHWQEAIVVAHSGFGSLLPLVADLVGASREATMVFVDAGLPPCHGQTTPSADLLDHLRSLAVEGVLPRWSHWWGDHVMEVLVSDSDRRTAIENELPEIPLTFLRVGCRGSIGLVRRDWGVPPTQRRLPARRRGGAQARLAGNRAGGRSPRHCQLPRRHRRRPSQPRSARLTEAASAGPDDLFASSSRVISTCGSRCAFDLTAPSGWGRSAPTPTGLIPRALHADNGAQLTVPGV